MDYGQFACPVAFYHREAFWRGELPLWNPLSNCGVPFLAQWNTLTLYPLSLVYLLLPFPWSLGMFCVLHLFGGGMGMYLLASRWTGNRLAGALAGTAYAFNGMASYGLIWPHITVALAWMPWVVLGVERAWEGGRRELVQAAAAGTMQMLSGGVEVIFLTWLVLAGLCVARVAGDEGNRGRVMFRLLLAYNLVICAAILILEWHYAVDLPGGIAVGALALAMVGPDETSSLKQN